MNGPEQIRAAIQALPGPMICRENFKRAHVALHVLWTKHAKEPGYIKALWNELSNAIYKLATDGPGVSDPTRPAAPPPAGGSEPGGER